MQNLGEYEVDDLCNLTSPNIMSFRPIKIRIIRDDAINKNQEELHLNSRKIRWSP